MTALENPHAGQGPVLLDVGGDVGALLVRMPAGLEGVEIEIRTRQPDGRVGAHHHGHDHHGEEVHGGDTMHVPDTLHVSHVQVLRRPTPEGVVVCAVFPSLLAGDYELYQRPFGPVRLQVSITGGQVAQESWPGPGTEG
jgi:hypothetical protein